MFVVFRDKSKPQHNETIWSLHYCKVVRQQKENTKEWIGHLRINVNDCGFKEKRWKIERTGHKLHKWWQYDNKNNKRANTSLKDQWNHQWTSVMLSQESYIALSPKSNFRCDIRKQRVWCCKNAWATEPCHRQYKSKQQRVTKQLMILW